MHPLKRFHIVLIVLVLLIGFASISHAQGADNFDKFRQCKVDCNEAFGGVDVFPSTRSPMGHAECIQQCERKFWKEFDRQNRTKTQEQD